MWNHEASRDTGNGAMIHSSRSPQFPQVVQCEFTSYCGREEDKTWYEVDGDPSRRHFATAEAAAREAEKLRSIPTATLKAELERRRAV